MRVHFLLPVLLVAGCIDTTDYTTVPEDPVVLFENVRSYDSPEVVKSKLDAPSWVLLENARLQGDRLAPSYEVMVVSAGSIMHHGVPGEVRLEFYNDRLAKVWFSPEDPESYFEALGLSVPRTNGPVTNADGSFLTVNIGRMEIDDRPYIYWLDQRLSYEWSAWNFKNAS